MKTEDIDKKIGMPNVDEEWAKFEREVIGEETKPRKRAIVGWTVGIAASIALLAGIFFWGNGTEKPTDSSGDLAQANNTQTQENNHAADGDESLKDTTRNSKSQENRNNPRDVFEETVTNNKKSNPTGELLAQATPSKNPKMEEQVPLPDKKTENSSVFSVVEQSPHFRGGYVGLQDFIKQHLQYPPTAQAYGANGRVIMLFKIDSLGYISEVKSAGHILKYDTLLMSRESEARQIELEKQIVQELEQECARVIALMPRWAPGRIRGKSVSTKYSLPFNFKPSEFLEKASDADSTGKPQPK